MGQHFRQQRIGYKTHKKRLEMITEKFGLYPVMKAEYLEHRR